MKRLAMALIGGVFAASSLPCAAEPACTEVAVEARVEAGGGELSLADLLARGSCRQLRESAERVNLGAVPRTGMVRVLDGHKIRRMLEELAGGDGSLNKNVTMRIPERIVVRRAGATKSCDEIARFLAGAASSQNVESTASQWQDLDCAAARDIPEETALELSKTGWNAGLRRWEFALRCARPEDCVPFLVWAKAERNAAIPRAGAPRGTGRRSTASSESHPLSTTDGSGQRLVKPGQTATLTWNQAGIRIVLPVTCLDAGGLGEFVRVRFRNAARILRAEVVGEGRLRANL